MTELGGQHRLLYVWLTVAAVACTVMWLVPGQETIPYHLAWIALALAYDRAVWPLRLTVAVTILFTVISGGILFMRAGDQVVGWQETAEVPLMSGLLLLVIWNIRRRHHALAELERVATQDRHQAAVRERFSRVTSHELRTPATIALGYTHLLMERETDPQSLADLEIVQSELQRLVMVSDRLVRMIQVPEQNKLEDVNLHDLMLDTVDRWRVTANRVWSADTDDVRVHGSTERIRACLDTLIENAERYTEDGGTVRVIGLRSGDQALIGVADSGPGLDDRASWAINNLGLAFDAMDDAASVGDPKSQTGLGLSLVRETAEALGGRLVAGQSSEGGALLLMVVPAMAPVAGRGAGASLAVVG